MDSTRSGSEFFPRGVPRTVLQTTGLLIKDNIIEIDLIAEA